MFSSEITTKILPFQNLEALLISTSAGRFLLDNRLNLTTEMQRNLVNLIIDKFYNNGQYLGARQCRIMAHKITGVFPNESSDTYMRIACIRPGKGADYSGKLVNGYKSFIKKMKLIARLRDTC
jgi:hypothetical protein